MNFLSHFYFDRESDPKTRGYHTLGTILPDLLKNADKSINIHPEKLSSTEPLISEIIYGWKKHLEVDRYFHSSEYFIVHSSQLRRLLAPVIAGSPVKAFFLGHITLELILDNLLLTTNKVSADNFYEHLGFCDQDVIDNFLHFSGLADTSQFFRFYESFVRNRYLHTYTDTQQIAYALRRICMRIWSDPFTTEQEGRMNAIISDYRDDLLPGFMSIFDQIDDKLNDNKQ